MKAIILGLISIAAWAQCSSPYGYQRSITVSASQITGTLSSFPMLVQNPSPSLKTTGNGGRLTSANGYDVIFVDGSGTPLSFELVGHGTSSTTYSATTGDAEFWVNVPTILVGTQIFMCYGAGSVTTYQGNDIAAWPAAAVAVWHMANGSTLSVVDSTGTNTGTNHSSTAVAGKVDGGLGLSGTSQYVTAADAAAMHLTGDLSISMWIKPSNFGNYNMLINRNGNSNTFGSFEDVSTGVVLFQVGNAQANGGTGISTSVWTKVDMVKSSDILSIYLNGSGTLDGSPGTNTATITDAGQTTYIASRSDYTTPTFPGLMDEITVYNVARSAAWRQAEYNNQVNPATFYAVGSEIVAAAASFTASPTAVPTNNGANITLLLTGVGTAWAAETFSISGVSGVTKIGQSIASGTAATLTITTGSTAGILTISDGTLNTTITVGIGSTVDRSFIVIH